MTRRKRIGLFVCLAIAVLVVAVAVWTIAKLEIRTVTYSDDTVEVELLEPVAR